jgi:hypothetical protein
VEAEPRSSVIPAQAGIQEGGTGWGILFLSSEAKNLMRGTAGRSDPMNALLAKILPLLIVFVSLSILPAGWRDTQ